MGVGHLDHRGNMESLQRDGLAGVNAVDAFRLPVRQNNNTCLCTVSRPTTDLNFYPPPPPQKKKKTKKTNKQKQKQNKTKQNKKTKHFV